MRMVDGGACRDSPGDRGATGVLGGGGAARWLSTAALAWPRVAPWSSQTYICRRDAAQCIIKTQERRII